LIWALIASCIFLLIIVVSFNVLNFLLYKDSELFDTRFCFSFISFYGAISRAYDAPATVISKKMQEAINAQINAELWSAYLYLSMSMDAADKGARFCFSFISFYGAISRAYDAPATVR